MAGSGPFFFSLEQLLTGRPMGMLSFKIIRLQVFNDVRFYAMGSWTVRSSCEIRNVVREVSALNTKIF